MRRTPLIRRAPVVRYLLVVQMSLAGDQRSMAFRFCPRDRFVLGFETGKRAIRMIFDNVLSDWIGVPPFRTRLDVNVRHGFAPLEAAACPLDHRSTYRPI